uniref:HECT-domain (Ubiquitin-transferase) domain-containing protein n=1 Tax=Macrostomum lignano TaxID=282301 RepID=A0A1I8IAN3_9PLAT
SAMKPLAKLLSSDRILLNGGFTASTSSSGRQYQRHQLRRKVQRISRRQQVEQHLAAELAVNQFLKRVEQLAQDEFVQLLRGEPVALGQAEHEQRGHSARIGVPLAAGSSCWHSLLQVLEQQMLHKRMPNEIFLSERQQVLLQVLHDQAGSFRSQRILEPHNAGGFEQRQLGPEELLQDGGPLCGIGELIVGGLNQLGGEPVLQQLRSSALDSSEYPALLIAAAFEHGFEHAACVVRGGQLGQFASADFEHRFAQLGHSAVSSSDTKSAFFFCFFFKARRSFFVGGCFSCCCFCCCCCLLGFFNFFLSDSFRSSKMVESFRFEFSNSSSSAASSPFSASSSSPSSEPDEDAAARGRLRFRSPAIATAPRFLIVLARLARLRPMRGICLPPAFLSTAAEFLLSICSSAVAADGSDSFRFLPPGRTAAAAAAPSLAPEPPNPAADFKSDTVLRNADDKLDLDDSDSEDEETPVGYGKTAHVEIFIHQRRVPRRVQRRGRRGSAGCSGGVGGGSAQRGRRRGQRRGSGVQRRGRRRGQRRVQRRGRRRGQRRVQQRGRRRGQRRCSSGSAAGSAAGSAEGAVAGSAAGSAEGAAAESAAEDAVARSVEGAAARSAEGAAAGSAEGAAARLLPLSLLLTMRSGKALQTGPERVNLSICIGAAVCFEIGQQRSRCCRATSRRSKTLMSQDVESDHRAKRVANQREAAFVVGISACLHEPVHHPGQSAARSDAASTSRSVLAVITKLHQSVRTVEHKLCTVSFDAI